MKIKTYKAYLKQQGEGCDYTIGCAQTVIDIEAYNLTEAETQLIELIADEYNSDENRLESVELYEVSEIINLDIVDIYKTLRLLEESARNSSKDKKERLEYERLKAKFDK
jgi:hypothetical protein